MIDLKELKIYLQGDTNNEVKDLIERHVLPYDVLLLKTKNEHPDSIYFKIKNKDISNIQQHKNSYNYHIFVLNPSNKDISLYGDIIDSCHTNPHKTIILLKIDKGKANTLKDIVDFISFAEKIVNRQIAILNDNYSILSFIAETNKDTLVKNKQENTLKEINFMYDEIKDKMPSLIFEQFNKIETIRNVVLRYIVDNSLK